MIGANHEAQQMRNDDTDKADATADRNRCAGGRGDGDNGDAFEALYRDAEVAGRCFPEGEPVEARNGEMTRASAMSGPDAAILTQLAPASDPSPQNVRSRNCLSSAT